MEGARTHNASRNIGCLRVKLIATRSPRRLAQMASPYWQPSKIRQLRPGCERFLLCRSCVGSGSNSSMRLLVRSSSAVARICLQPPCSFNPPMMWRRASASSGQRLGRETSVLSTSLGPQPSLGRLSPSSRPLHPRFFWPSRCCFSHLHPGKGSEKLGMTHSSQTGFLATGLCTDQEWGSLSWLERVERRVSHSR